MHVAQLMPMFLLLQSTLAVKCYTPAGEDRNAQMNASALGQYEPCNNIQGKHSMCCATGPERQKTGPDSCTKDGLCKIYLGDALWRESCTDPTWQDPACIKLFVNGTGYQGGRQELDDFGKLVTDVLVTDCGDGSYCYGDRNLLCCRLGQGVFIDAQGQQTNQNTYATTSTTGPSTSPTTPVTTSNTSSDHGDGLPTSTKIAIGLGIALGVFAIIMLSAWFLFVRRRRTRHSSKAEVREIMTEHRGPPQPQYHEIGSSIGSDPVKTPNIYKRPAAELE